MTLWACYSIRNQNFVNVYVVFLDLFNQKFAQALEKFTVNLLYTEVINLKDYDPEDNLTDEVCVSCSYFWAHPGVVPVSFFVSCVRNILLCARRFIGAEQMCTMFDSCSPFTWHAFLGGL